VTIDQFSKEIVVIEDLVDPDAAKIIIQDLQLTKPLKKAQIRRFFQERLASDKVLDLVDRI